MTSSARRRSGWIALSVTLIARMLLGILASLLLWAVAPAAIGWHPTVVMTGSMMPRLHPGDIVESKPTPADELHLGETLLYDDPDQAGKLRLHRWIRTTPGGQLVTKGDANPDADSTPIDASAVHGVAALRVPVIGSPIVWVADHEGGKLAAGVVGLIALLAAACWFKAEERDDDVTGPDDERPPRTEGRRGRHRGTQEPDLDRPRRSRRLAGVATAVAATVALGTGFAANADAAARFTRATVNPTSTLAAARYFSCSGAASSDGANLTYPLNETSGTVANDLGPYNLDGTYTGGYTLNQAGPCNNSRGVLLNGSTGQVVTPATSKFQGPNTFTWEIWFKTTTTRGGKIIGFETTQSASNAGQYDRHVYMTNTGTLVFGVYDNTTSTVDSGTKRYNDGKWHLVDASLGSAGMRLYVDGALVDSDSTVTFGENDQGWLRIGGGTLGGAWPSVPTSTFFAGTVAYASAYLTALSPTQIAGHYAAGA